MRCVMRLPLLLTLLLGGSGLASCADSTRWSNEPGESWCGSVTSATFVRAGMKEGTKLRLELDADSLQSAPGRLWTSPFLTAERLAGARLRPIPQLLHDPLSTLSFGEGRAKNAIAIADLPATATAPATQVLVVISLLQSGEVEVRLIRGASPGSATDPATDPPQLFGVFRLTREKGDCGLR